MRQIERDRKRETEREREREKEREKERERDNERDFQNLPSPKTDWLGLCNNMMRMKSLHLKTFCPSNVCLRRSPYSDPVSDEALYWLTWKERPLVLVNPKGRA